MLQDTAQQNVTTDNQTIVIQSTNPDVVYVPYYDPWYVYGDWPYTAYPPYPYYPYPGYGLATAGIGFLAGAAIANWWNNPHVDWRGGNININNDFNRNNIGSGNRWQHKPEHRRGTNYRDAATRQRFGQSDGLANARQDFRGRNPGGPQITNPLAGSGNRFGPGSAAVQNQIAGNRGTSVADRRGTSSSFTGIGQAPQTRFEANRGYSSRSSSQGNRSAANRSFSSGGVRGGGGFRGGGGGFRGGGGGGRR